MFRHVTLDFQLEPRADVADLGLTLLATRVQLEWSMCTTAEGCCSTLVGPA